MDTTAIKAIALEAAKASQDLADPIEGLNDYLRSNIPDPTRGIIERKVVEVNTRNSLLNAVIHACKTLVDAIDALIADGYPDFPPEEIDAKPLSDLDGEIRTETAARGLFTGHAVTTKVEATVTKRPTR